MSIIGSRQFEHNAPGNDYIRDGSIGDDDDSLYNPYSSYMEGLKSDQEKRAFQRDAAQFFGEIKTAGEISEMFDHESRKLTAKERFIKSQQGSAPRPYKVPGPKKAQMPKKAEDFTDTARSAVRRYRDLRTELASGSVVPPKQETKKPKLEKGREPERKFKTASRFPPQIRATAQRAFEFASDFKDPQVAAIAGTGALGLGTSTYLASRPKEDLGGKSKSEVELEHSVNAAKAKDKSKAKLPERVGDRTQEFAHGLSQEFRKNPAAAGVMGAGVGAMLGRSLAHALGAGK